MSADQLFIGIDSGTQGTKGVVFSREDGRIQAEAYTDHQLIENIGGRREQNPHGGSRPVPMSSANC